MEKFFENKFTYNQIFFCHTNKTEIDEREIHSYHELLFYLGGEIPFRTELFSKTVGKNSLIIIPKERYHYFDNKLTPPFERLKITFPDVAEAEWGTAAFEDVRIINPPSDEMLFALKRIVAALESGGGKTERCAAYGAFLILLAEVMKVSGEKSKTFRNNSKVVSECIEFINANLKRNVSIEEISKKLNVSKSSITHGFKKEMGISVHRYIRQKRMVLAKKLIEEGHKPTKICFDCGYSEYSAFYKAYCKMFGSPPVRRKPRD